MASSSIMLPAPVCFDIFVERYFDVFLGKLLTFKLKLMLLGSRIIVMLFSAVRVRHLSIHISAISELEALNRTLSPWSSLFHIRFNSRPFNLSHLSASVLFYFFFLF